MAESSVQQNIPSNMDVIVVIDKEKLPEDVRKLLEENLPKCALEQLKLSQEKIKMLGRPPPISNKSMSNSKLSGKSTSNIPDDKLKDNRLFAIQTGSVVGNIYTDGLNNKDNLEQLTADTVSNKLSKDSGGCC